MKIFLICCEKSGNNIIDQILNRINNSLSNKDIEIAGIVYDETATKYNIKQIFHPKELALIGIGDIIFSIPKIIEKIENTANQIINFKPDLVISVDAYDFCVRIIKKVRKLEEKNFNKDTNKTVQAWHIVAPSVWAYWSFRAKILAKYYDRLFYFLPFEFNYFKQLERVSSKNHRGFLSTFIGYPASFQTRNSNIKKDINLIGITIGSRKNEINRHKDLIISIIMKLKMINKNFKFAMFTTTETTDLVKQSFVGIQNIEFFDKNSDKLNTIQKCVLVIAKDGTNNIEIGALGTPMIIYYKTSILTYLFGRIFIRKIKLISLFNIILKKQVVPEFIQGKATSDNLVQTVIKLISSDDLRNQQIKHIDEAISLMQRKDKKHPFNIVCEEILNFVTKK